MGDIPELPTPPPGTPEYDAWAAEDKGPAISIVCWLFMALSTVLVAGRVYVRMRQYSKLRSDDYWCIAGLLCGYLATAFSQVSVSNGNGKHFALLTIPQRENVIFWTTVSMVPGVLSFGLPKLAVVALLTRLLNPGRLHKWFLWFLVIWGVLTLIAVGGMLVGQCRPAKSQWNFDMEGECAPKIHIANFSLYAGVYSAFVDFYLAIYPAIVLFKLQMKLQKKLALTVALGIGLVSGVVAVYKSTRIPFGLRSPDFSYDSSDVVIWTIIEGATIIMACSIPVLSPLIDLIFKHNPFRSSSPRQDRYYDKYHLQPRSRQQGTDATPRRKPRTMTELEMELGETGLGDANSSQDSIMPKRSDDLGGSSIATAEARHSRNFSRLTRTRSTDSSSPALPQLPPMSQGQIVRTDEVRVSYGAPGELSLPAAARTMRSWSPEQRPMKDKS